LLTDKLTVQIHPIQFADLT